MIGNENVCIYCGGDFYVAITHLHNIQMSHETGITASGTDETIILCEQCFYDKIWNNPTLQNDHQTDTD